MFLPVNTHKYNRTTWWLLLIALFGIIAPSFAANFLFSPLNTTDGLSDNQVRYIQQLPDGRMVFTTNGNVNLYNGISFTYIHRTPVHTYPLCSYDGFYRVYAQGDSLLWIKDHYKLYCIDLKEERYREGVALRFQEKGVEGELDDLFVDDKGEMWLLQGQRLWERKSGNSFDLSIHEGTLQDLITEKDHLYLFYNTGIVACYDLASGKLHYQAAAYEAAERPLFCNTSLVVKGAAGFYQLRNGRKGGFFHFDPTTRQWQTLLQEDYSLNTLIITPDEKAYISCVNGIWIIDPQEEKREYLPALETTTGERISTEFSTIFTDRQGGLWVGTLNRGLLYHHPTRYLFQRYGRNAFAGLNERELIVQRFAEDAEGQIFLQCQGDLFQLESAEGATLIGPISRDQLSPSVANQLTSTANPSYRGERYTALCTDSRGWTWAGTADGLLLFKDSITTPRRLYMEDGLANNCIHAILEDQQQHLWVTTSHGVSKIEVDNEEPKIHFINYNQYDGTLEGEYAQGALFEASDGRIFLGGIDGFNVHYPALLQPPSLPHKPLFTNLRLFGESVKQGERYDNRLLLCQTAPYTSSIELAHHQNFLSFEFSALNYRNAAQTYYRYQLEGVDAAWQEVSVSEQGSRVGSSGILQLTYTNLAPGRYRLKVISTDQPHHWQGKTTEIDILIHTPWWKSPTAYLLYLLALILIVWSTVRLYISMTKAKLKRQHREEILLVRIKGLIEQCSQYEAIQQERTHPTMTPTEGVQEELATTPYESHTENDLFVAQAMEWVEKNLDNPSYSVEQLSRDLCMERTGLYRKLTAMLDQSPSLFIRNIRLKRAAQLLLEKRLTITEISEIVGFSSASYFGKCFHERYGCKPSEYAEKQQEST